MLFDLERPFPTIITQQPELMQDMIRARDRISTAQAYHLDYVLNDAVKRLDSFDTVQARSIDLNDVADLARTVGEGLIQADVESTADLGRQIIRNFEYALGLKGNRDAVMNPELIRALSNTRKYTRTAAVLLDKIAVGARVRVRAQLLQRIIDLLRVVEGGEVLEQNKRSLVVSIDWYLDFALLEERTSQRIPAFESVFIVREPRS